MTDAVPLIKCCPSCSCSYFNAFEKQLLTPGLANYSAFVAPGSLVDWFLANELIKSANDGYRGSVYFWKDADTACKVEGELDGL